MSGPGNVKNGAQVFGLVLPEDFHKVIIDRALKENRPPQEVLVSLAITGAECERRHQGVAHKRTA
jgi:hypothetical protein